MPSLVPQTSFRLSVEDLAILDAIAEHLGTTSRNQTLRVMLRQYARARGIVPKGIEPKPSAPRKSPKL